MQQRSLFDTGTTPYQPSSDTSREAAVAIQPHLNKLQSKVLRFLTERGEHGATDEEIQTALEMSPSTQRPRRIELAGKGLIVKSEEKRKTKSGRSAQVWKIA